MTSTVIAKLFQLPKELSREILQYVRLNDIARLQLACGKNLHDQLQKIIEGMTYIPEVTVIKIRPSGSLYIQHLRWALTNKVSLQSISIFVNNNSHNAEVYYNFLKELFTYSGHNILVLTLVDIQESSLDFIKSSLLHVPNVTCLTIAYCVNEVDIIELCSHLPLQSLRISHSSRQYKASKIFSIWPALHTISVPLIFDSEMSLSRGQSLRELQVIIIDQMNCDFLKYFPNLERLCEKLQVDVNEDHIKSIAKYCPHLQSLETLLQPCTYGYLSHLAHCHQLRELIIGFNYAFSPRNSIRCNGIDALPQIQSLTCIYDRYLLRACKNLTKLNIDRILHTSNIIENMSNLMRLTTLEMYISSDYDDNTWSLHMMLLLTEWSQLKSLKLMVLGGVTQGQDILYDIIGFGHQKLQYLSISTALPKYSRSATSVERLPSCGSRKASIQQQETDEDGTNSSYSDLSRSFKLSVLRDRRNENATAETYWKCPMLVSMDIRLPLKASTYRQLARCSNLQRVKLTTNEVDFRMLLDSCSKLQTLYVSAQDVCNIFHYSHDKLEQLHVSIPEHQTLTNQIVFGKFPALRRVKFSGNITTQMWQTFVKCCKGCHIHRLEFDCGRNPTVFNDEFIESIKLEDIFRELKYFVWNRFHSNDLSYFNKLKLAIHGRITMISPCKVDDD